MACCPQTRHHGMLQFKDAQQQPSWAVKDKDKENWMKIDDKAAVVNGKLVYLEDEKPSLAEPGQLVQQLRQNGIKIKQYIYGDKANIAMEM